MRRREWLWLAGVVGAAGIALAALSAIAAPRYVPGKTQGDIEVDVELIFAIDISYSMDYDELKLQRDGYVEALISQEFLSALKQGTNGKVAVTLVEWAGENDQRIVTPWRLIDGPASAQAASAEMAAAPVRRAFRTSISGALQFTAPLVDGNGFRGIRRVIDVSGDGTNNQGPLVALTRDDVVAKGIVINGLPILINPSTTFSHLDQYYAQCVTGGPGSFVLPIYAAAEFSTAIRRKLILEVSGIQDKPWVIPVDADAPIDCLQGERDRRFLSDPYFPELDR